MCLAVSGRIVEIKDGYAKIDHGGLFKNASLRFFKDAKAGDYALVHAGFVIQLLDEQSGAELENLIKETTGFNKNG